MPSCFLPCTLQAVRNESYHNYFNLEDAVTAAQPRIDAEALQARPGGRFYDFYRCGVCSSKVAACAHAVQIGCCTAQLSARGWTALGRA